MIRHADWIVDVGPAAGQHGGEILYSGPHEGLAGIEASQTRAFVLAEHTIPRRTLRTPTGMLELAGVTRNNLDHRDRRVGLRQVEPRRPGARRAGGGAPRQAAR